MIGFLKKTLERGKVDRIEESGAFHISVLPHSQYLGSWWVGKGIPENNLFLAIESLY